MQGGSAAEKCCLQCSFPIVARGDRSGIRPDLVGMLEEILTVLDRATTIQALNLPGYRLHPLKGDRKGYWSVTVRANWRMVFRFDEDDGTAFDVELIDYH